MIKTSVWFTFFFIPIFPYEVDYLFLCPVCNNGFKIERTEFDEMKPIAETNQSLIDGKISEQEHNRLMIEYRQNDRDT